jgi:hypothetical protein
MAAYTSKLHKAGARAVLTPLALECRLTVCQLSAQLLHLPPPVSSNLH